MTEHTLPFAERLAPGRLIAMWLDFSRPVPRAEYVVSGMGSMAVKYVLDSVILYLAAGALWPPLAYLDPRFLGRLPVPVQIPSWPFAFLALAALPFVWLGVTLSARRAMNAGLSGWLGVLFCVPFVNYLLILVLSVVPTASRPPPEISSEEPQARPTKGALWAASLALIPALAALATSVLVWETYGWTLFVATPFAMGLVSAYLYAREAPRTPGECLAVGSLAVILGSSALLLFMLEGLICIAMALPPALLLAWVGAMLGHLLANNRRTRPAHLSMVLLLPLLALTEVQSEPATREVLTVIEIDAPPAEVWPHVVAFPDLPAPRRWPFRLGIAYPTRARIEGAGVGAIRTCHFSTGAFVEPITVWSEPHHLAFDVTAQPPPMRELSPYREVHAPHLLRSLTVERGEFRLLPTAGGDTRLEGRTWYRLRIFPQAYWTLWSDFLIGSIHRRVLEHVGHLAGDESRAGDEGNRSASR